jgi:hypothetical protein
MLAYGSVEFYIEKMQESLPNTYPFPRAIGTEEETGMLVGLDGVYDEPYDLCTSLNIYLPEALKGQGQTEYLLNGSRIYTGGTDDGPTYSTNLERATPETISPWQLAEYSRGSEVLVEEVLKKYAYIQADYYKNDVDIRMHRRVVDAFGNRKACHDNYSIEEEFIDREQMPQSLAYLLAARSLVVGAGLVTEDGYQYAQKIGGLKAVYGYGYFGSMYRTDKEHGDRLEIRCSDQNISDWATVMRVGSVALLLALDQTPIGQKLEQSFKYIKSDEDVLTEAKDLNLAITLGSDEIYLSKAQLQGIDFMEQLATLTMDKLQLYADLPISYHVIAKELLTFCEDFRKVAKNEEHFSILADRADWAAKLSVIQHGIERDASFGIIRELGDYTSQAADMNYDMVRITRSPDDEKEQVRRGSGYRLREKGSFKYTVNESAVQTAYNRAPPQTRAHARAYLLKNYFAKHCYWHKVFVGDIPSATIELNDVNLPDLDQENIEAISIIEKLGS